MAFLIALSDLFEDEIRGPFSTTDTEHTRNLQTPNMEKRLLSHPGRLQRLKCFGCIHGRGDIVDHPHRRNPAEVLANVSVHTKKMNLPGTREEKI